MARALRSRPLSSGAVTCRSSRPATARVALVAGGRRRQALDLGGALGAARQAGQLRRQPFPVGQGGDEKTGHGQVVTGELPGGVVGGDGAQVGGHVFGEGTDPGRRVVPVEGKSRADRSRRPDADQGTGTEAALVVVDQADGDDRHPLDGIVGRRPQGDAGGARPQLLEVGLVVADPLGEDGHHPASGQQLPASGERLVVAPLRFGR